MGRIGCIDTLADTCISGWAADDAGGGEPVQVQIMVNSQVAGTVACEIFRQDLLAAGIGDGCKAFRFDPSAYLKPGRNNLEVRFAGTGVIVHGGRGHWVRRREGKISAWEAALLAALEAYHEFTPEDHICGIGPGAAELGDVLLAAGIPFKQFTSLKTPSDIAKAGLAVKADVLVSWAPPEPFPELAALLRQHDLLAIGFVETSQAPGQIRRALQGFRVRLESIQAAAGGDRRMFAFADAGRVKAQGGKAMPVLAHIHVPKCAGTSFRNMLERYWGTKHLGLYVNDTYFAYGEETLRSYLLQQDPAILALSSHHVRTFPHWLAGREMLYVTFLRDPVQQFVSYMTHIQKHYATITSPSLLAAVPPDAPNLTLREFARWLLTNDRDIPFRENHNVNFFARHSAPAAIDGLAAAKAVLGGFFFVGITERMEESIGKLRALADQAGLDFPPGPMPMENTSADYRDDLSWINPDDEIGSMLLRSVEKDRQLYDWAAERLNG